MQAGGEQRKPPYKCIFMHLLFRPLSHYLSPSGLHTHTFTLIGWLRARRLATLRQATEPYAMFDIYYKLTPSNMLIGWLRTRRLATLRQATAPYALFVRRAHNAIIDVLYRKR